MKILKHLLCLFSLISSVDGALFDPDLETLSFYHEEADFGIFSNFWIGKPLRFTLVAFDQKVDQEGIVTSENIYQASKALFLSDEEALYQILNAKTPKEAVRLKGLSNPVFQKALIETGARYLMENTSELPYRIDYIWGNGPSENGQNRLGLSLMLYRMELKEELDPIPYDLLWQMILQERSS